MTSIDHKPMSPLTLEELMEETLSESNFSGKENNVPKNEMRRDHSPPKFTSSPIRNPAAGYFSPRKQPSQEYRHSQPPRLAWLSDSRSTHFKRTGSSSIANLQTEQEPIQKSEFDVTLPSLIFNKSNEGQSPQISPCRPISARSNATSITLIGSDAQSDQLQDQISTLFADNSRLKALVSQLREHVSNNSSSSYSKQNSIPHHVSDKIECLTDEIEANQRQIRKNEQDLEMKDLMCLEKDKIICELEANAFHIRSDLAKSSSIFTRLKSEKESFKQQSLKYSQRIKDLQHEMAEKFNESQRMYMHDLDKLTTEHNSVLEEVSFLKAKNLHLTSELETTQSERNSLQNKSVSQGIEVSKTLDQAQTRIRDLVDELAAKHKQIKKFTIEKAQLQSLNQELSSTLSKLEKQDESHNVEISTFKKENDKLKNEFKSLKSNLDQARHEVKELKNKVTIEQQKTMDDSINCTATRQHQSAILELEMKLASKEAYNKRLEARLASHTAESEKLEQIQCELLEVVEKSRIGERKTNQLEEMVHSLEEEKSSLVKKINDLEDHIKDKSLECESLEQRLSDRTSTLKENQVVLEDEQKNRLLIKQRADEMKLSLAKNAKELSNMKVENENLSKRVTESEEVAMEKTRALENASSKMSKEQMAHRQELKKAKKIHTEQTDQLLEQVAVLEKDSKRYKSKATSSSMEVAGLRDSLEESERRIASYEKRILHMEREEVSRNQSHEEAVNILEKKLATNSLQVCSLEESLESCKSELSVYVNQLGQTHSSFQQQVTAKCSQIARLESEAKLAQSAILDESRKRVELEGALQERHVMIEQAASRIAELEESQTTLQSKVGMLEQRLSREDASNKCLVQEMDDKLRIAYHELDSKKNEYRDLNDALKTVDEEFEQCKEQLESIEDHVTELTRENNDKSNELECVQFEWKEMKGKLEEKIEQVSTIEERLGNTARELKKSQEKCSDLEEELMQQKIESGDEGRRLEELQIELETCQGESREKESAIKHLHETKRSLGSEVEWKSAEVTRLERIVEERQRQLQQRAQQLSHIDAQVQNFRSDVEKRNLDLAAKLKTAEDQLKERNGQVAHLDEQLGTMRDEMSEIRHTLDQELQVANKLHKDLEKSDARVAELEQVTDEGRSVVEESQQRCFEIAQELRLSREREQSVTKQYQDSQRKLVRCEKQIEQIKSELNQLNALNGEKDQRIGNLAQQLSSSTSSKISVESRFENELDKMQGELMRLNKQHTDEVESLKSTNRELERHLAEQSIRNNAPLDEAAERHARLEEESKSMRQVVLELEQELLARKQVIEAANDTIIVKDSQIARLQARLSGMERNKTMTSSTIDRRPIDTDSTLDSFLVSPQPQHTPPCNQWGSPYKEGSTVTSLFTGIDSELDSLAQSYVPIAPRSGNIKEITKKDDNDVSGVFFMTSSPTRRDARQTGGGLADEDSLYRRVFADSLQASMLDKNPGLGTPLDQHDVFGSLARSELDPVCPDKCVSDLQEKLRMSERRRQCITAKLNNLTSFSGS